MPARAAPVALLELILASFCARRARFCIPRTKSFYLIYFCTSFCSSIFGTGGAVTACRFCARAGFIHPWHEWDQWLWRMARKRKRKEGSRRIVDLARLGARIFCRHMKISWAAGAPSSARTRVVLSTSFCSSLHAQMLVAPCWRSQISTSFSILVHLPFPPRNLDGASRRLLSTMNLILHFCIFVVQSILLLYITFLLLYSTLLYIYGILLWYTCVIYQA